MKKFALFLLVLVYSGFASAQLKGGSDCGAITIDVYKGTVNGVRPDFDPEQIKIKLTCFSSFEKEANESKCGGGVYYESKDITFYTRLDYVVIGEKFKGTTTMPLFGQKSDDLFVKLGNPKVHDANWEAYQMSYGTLIVYYNDKGLIKSFIISTKPTEQLDLCNEVSK